MQTVARLGGGSRVALIAPAGPIDETRLGRAIELCSELGLEPVIGDSVLARWQHLAGTDAARAADLQRALDAEDIDAIWALRGGYGVMRLLPLLDFSRFLAAPKAYIGFSDNTAMHLMLSRQGIVSFHGPHAGGDWPSFTAAQFRRIMFDGATGVLDVPADAPLTHWNGGVCDGWLAGGNLALLAAAAGTPYALDGNGAIVFIEDIGEPAYRVDRMLTQLLHSNAFNGVRGFVIGQFTDCDEGVLEIVRERLSVLDVPMVANAPFGHVADNWTIPVGALARLDADRLELTLVETGMRE